jgi:uncharacterized membrane protein YeaQ/YmgE (transglycosylase-associated protein family)
MVAMALSELARHWANEVLLWIGFGTVVGLLAKAIMPGRDPGGAIITLLLGIAGSVIGLGTLKLFWEGAHVSPISLVGFPVATAGAFFLLFFYRLLAGQLFQESEDHVPGTLRLHRAHRKSGAVKEK